MQASSFVATLQEVFIIIVCPKTVTFFVYTVTDSSTFRWGAGGGRGGGGEGGWSVSGVAGVVAVVPLWLEAKL